MPDLRTAFDGAKLAGDLALTGAALDTDDGLETAIVLSLFSDARALPADELPAGETDPRGWWGDGVDPPAVGDRFGSRLWLLSREKQTQQTLNRAREYAAEALRWLVDDGIATSVDVQAEWVRMGLLGLAIAITLVDGTLAEHQFQTPLGG